MCENFKNGIFTDTSATTDELHKSILLISLTLTALIVLVSLLAGKAMIARGFLLGAGISIIYLRMQVLFVKNFSKKDLVSILASVLAAGRIFIIAGALFVAFKRVDLFDLIATICGLAAVHLISFVVFTYNIYKNDKKNLVIS